MRISHLKQQRENTSDLGRPIDLEFTGPLILVGNPVEGTDAATKEYVDTRFQSLNAADIKRGVLQVGRLPAFSGDLTNVAGSNVFTLNPSGVTAGTYRKVTVDSKGRVIASNVLSASDIPNLDWNKITKNKPTTLAGYGITDGVKLSGDTITGNLKCTATPTDPMHAVTRGYVESVSAGMGGLVTPGIIVSSPTTTSPTGYLRCNGGEVSKSTYAALYAVIGDRFGGTTNLGNGKPWEQQHGFNVEQSANLTGWTTDTSLPGNVSLGSVAVTKNRVYLIAGMNGVAATNTVYTAPINSDGTLGAWTTGTNYPIACHSPAIFVTKNRIFGVAGWTSSGVISNVYSAPINSDGTIGTWAAGSAFPIATSIHKAIVTRGRVYVVGGSDGTNSLSAGYSAPINSDGTIGAWVADRALPVAMHAYCFAVVGSYLYLIGGNADAGLLSTVYRAPINADGTIGAWVTMTSLPIVLTHSAVVVTKQKVYLIGGNTTNGTSITAIYSATVNADGSLGAWTSAGTLASVRSTHAVLITSSKIYTLGGGAVGLGADGIVQRANFSGALNDYSRYYDGTYALSTNLTNFRLPDLTSKETTTEKFYIKF